MFGFISNYLRNRRNRKRHAARKIYHFWDGSDERGIDPMEVLRALLNHPTFSAERHYPVAVEPPEGTPDAVVNEARQICCQATREVFDIPAFRDVNGLRVGLTSDELLWLLASFGMYIQALKKNGSGLPITPLNSATAPSPPATSPPTNAPSASTSTAAEPQPAEASPC